MFLQEHSFLPSLTSGACGRSYEVFLQEHCVKENQAAEQESAPWILYAMPWGTRPNVPEGTLGEIWCGLAIGALRTVCNRWTGFGFRQIRFSVPERTFRGSNF